MGQHSQLEYREVLVHAGGLAQTQLFLIRALQGYQLASRGQRVHDEPSKRSIKKLTADMMGILFSVYKTSLNIFNVGSLLILAITV